MKYVAFLPGEEGLTIPEAIERLMAVEKDLFRQLDDLQRLINLNKEEVQILKAVGQLQRKGGE